MNQLAALFRERRAALGLSYQEVVERTPYSNLAKGTQRLFFLEEGVWTPDSKVLGWFAEALALSAEDLRQTQEQDFKEQDEKRTRRLPADSCSACGEGLETIGGRRLITTLSRAILIRGIPAYWAGKWREMHAVRLESPFDQLYVLLGGFNDYGAMLARARKHAQAGATPWFCQRCAGQICEKCGALFKGVPGSTFLQDDGKTPYFALLPIGDAACSNPECTRYR